jgi:hypothetical protein
MGIKQIAAVIKTALDSKVLLDQVRTLTEKFKIQG